MVLSGGREMMKRLFILFVLVASFALVLTWAVVAQGPEDVDRAALAGTLPDLLLSATHRPSLFSSGELMTYTVTYGNAGDVDAEGVVITTTLPLSTTYVGYGWSSSDGQTYTYAVGSLPAGDAGHAVTFTVAYPDLPQIGAAEFNTPFTIGGPDAGDDNPDDNTFLVTIGVPDLVVSRFVVAPIPPGPGELVTFTIVLGNLGTGKAWNPDNGSGFFVDVLTSSVASYPFERYGNIYEAVAPIEAGSVHTLVITHAGFSGQELGTISAFYVKADNFELSPFGLVPEYNEMNNVAGPVAVWPYGVYLPVVKR
jgi:uncharacterized repeat protein (TIGR01451 family)